jgi:hypothetical protein
VVHGVAEVLLVTGFFAANLYQSALGGWLSSVFAPNVFQSAAITAAIAVSFDTIGERNPLSATTFCLMVSVMNLPNTYMIIVDGWGHAWRGVSGSYVFDACASLAACALLAMLLMKIRGSEKSPAADAARLSAARD